MDVPKGFEDILKQLLFVVYHYNIIKNVRVIYFQMSPFKKIEVNLKIWKKFVFYGGR